MRTINVPNAVREALDRGAALVVSISGGKDSRAMLMQLAKLHRANAWKGPIVALHADLGRIEWRRHPDIEGWRSTDEQVRYDAEQAGVELFVVRRRDGRDMVDHWKARAAKLAGTGKPFWSSAKQRYCTSDLKREPMDQFVRARYRDVVVCEGLRAEESAARAKKAIVEVRQKVATAGRRALTWRPIMDFKLADVWESCGTSLHELNERRVMFQAGKPVEAFAGWVGHPAYVAGNGRLSCAICILQSRSDMQNGARHNPEVFAELLEMETSTGCRFRQDYALVDVARDLANGTTIVPEPAHEETDALPCAA